MFEASGAEDRLMKRQPLVKAALLFSRCLAGLFAVSVILGCGSPLEFTADSQVVAKIHSIAVLPMVDAPGAEGGYSGKTVAGILSQKLMNLRDVTVVERERLHAIIMEQELQASDLADSATATRVGRLLGADTVTAGSVTQYDSSSVPIFLGLVTHYVEVYTVGVSIRFIRVDTGEVCFSAHCSQTGSSYQEAASKCTDLVVSATATCRKKTAADR